MAAVRHERVRMLPIPISGRFHIPLLRDVTERLCIMFKVKMQGRTRSCLTINMVEPLVLKELLKDFNRSGLGFFDKGRC